MGTMKARVEVRRDTYTVLALHAMNDTAPCSFQLIHYAVHQISLRDLCRRLLARSTSATKFMYFENGYDDSSSSGASP